MEKNNNRKNPFLDTIDSDISIVLTVSSFISSTTCIL